MSITKLVATVFYVGWQRVVALPMQVDMRISEIVVLPSCSKSANSLGVVLSYIAILCMPAVSPYWEVNIRIVNY